MSAAVHRPPVAPARRAGVIAFVGGVVVIAAFSWATASSAQTASPSAPIARAAGPVAEQGVRWRDLKPSQQAALRPLEQQWLTIGPAHKQKWIELSANFSKRPPAEQARIQARMVEWAKLSAEQRGQARLHFQEANTLTPDDRKARWEAYQALPPEQKQQLAARAARAAPAAGVRPAHTETVTLRESQPKSNLVPNPAPTVAPKVIAPGVVQARPGATTTLITKRPMPPAHQQTGQPKIAATPEYVNKATLLPRRGPQGPATRSAAAPASGTSLAQ